MSAVENFRILVVEDEDRMREYVQEVLQNHGYDTLGAVNGLEVLPILEQEAPDLIILDLMMPYQDGLTTCREVRRVSQCPIIVLSGLEDEARKVLALEEGADDYLTKPFGSAELVARVRAVLRRANPAPPAPEAAAPPSPLVRFGDVVLDMEGNRVQRGGAFVHLTRTEFNLLSALAQHTNKVVDHQTLLQRVWGPEYRDEVEYLHVYMMRLRRKLEEDPSNPRHLLSEQGIGYSLVTA